LADGGGGEESMTMKGGEETRVDMMMSEVKVELFLPLRET
jgi:hypothetical protein